MKYSEIVAQFLCEVPLGVLVLTRVACERTREREKRERKVTVRLVLPFNDHLSSDAFGKHIWGWFELK